MRHIIVERNQTKVQARGNEHNVAERDVRVKRLHKASKALLDLAQDTLFGAPVTAAVDKNKVVAADRLVHFSQVIHRITAQPIDF